MKNISKLLVLFILLFVSCNKSSHNVTVKINVKGLNKAPIYLKRIDNNKLTTVDSLILNSQNSGILYANIKSPELLYLYLGNNINENRIAFFADKGVTEINTSANNFINDAIIKGSKQQKVFEQYKKALIYYKNKNLELIETLIEAKTNKNVEKIKATEKKRNNLLKQKYLYTINFALNNSDSEVAPYLAINELYNAKIKFLDTINNVLSPKVKASTYGLKLQEFINKRLQETNRK